MNWSRFPSSIVVGGSDGLYALISCAQKPGDCIADAAGKRIPMRQSASVRVLVAYCISVWDASDLPVIEDSPSKLMKAWKHCGAYWNSLGWIGRADQVPKESPEPLLHPNIVQAIVRCIWLLQQVFWIFLISINSYPHKKQRLLSCSNVHVRIHSDTFGR